MHIADDFGGIREGLRRLQAERALAQPRPCKWHKPPSPSNWQCATCGAQEGDLWSAYRCVDPTSNASKDAFWDYARGVERAFYDANPGHFGHPQPGAVVGKIDIKPPCDWCGLIGKHDPGCPDA